MAAMTLLVMPLIRKPVEEESAAPERGEQLGPHLLDMLERAVPLSAVRVGLWWGYHGHGIRGVGACTPSLGQPSKFPATVTEFLLRYWNPLVESFQMVPCLPSSSHGNPRLHVPH